MVSGGRQEFLTSFNKIPLQCFCKRIDPQFVFLALVFCICSNHNHAHLDLEVSDEYSCEPVLLKYLVLQLASMNC